MESINIDGIEYSISNNGMLCYNNLNSQVYSFSQSQDRNFTVLWNDPGPDTKTKEYVRLLRQHTELLKVKILRPYICKVSNNGSILILDWMQSNESRSALRSYDIDGNLILKKVIKGDISNIGISESGKYAICIISHNPLRNYDNLLTLFDLLNGVKIYDLRTPFWPDEYVFKEDEGIVILKNNYNEGLYKFAALNLNYRI